MTDDNFNEFDFETRAVRSGQQRSPNREHAEPIYPTSSYVFDTAAQAARVFSGDESGYIYSRFTNPTVKNFEQRLASLENGECCVATSSGMSAIYSTCMALLESGDHIVSSRSIFGSITILFDQFLSKFGIQVNYVPLTDVDAWEKAIKPNTRILFLETPSNPLTEVVDIRAIADLANKHNCILMVDNVLATPALQQPLTMGADIVVHSATKYIDGQGRCLGGAVIGNQKLVGEDVFGFLRTTGPSMSPFNAWVFLKGLETLKIRMDAHCRNAMELAKWLEQHPKVTKVYYPGLESHPGHKLAKRQMTNFGGLLSFEVTGGKKAAWQVMDACRILSITANLGDTKTTLTHPATTTHGRLSDDQREIAGISQSLVRVAVGLESIEDIKQDIARGLEG